MKKSKDPQPLKVVGFFAFVSSKKIKKRRFETKNFIIFYC